MALRITLIRHILATLLVASFALLTACGDTDEGNNSGATCATRDDCPEGQRCDSSGQCTSEALSCTTSSDCDFGDYCVDDKCADATCSGDSDCTDAVCVNDRCREGCSTNDDCADGQACNALTRLCEQDGCTVGSCPAYQTCNQTGTPPACEYTGDCNNDAVCAAYANQLDDGEDYICSTAQERCIVKPPCGSDTDCRVGEICEPRASDDKLTCRSGCRDNDACSIGQICDEASLTCVQGCDSNDDCTEEGDVCLDLVCVPTCSSRADCQEIDPGYICTGSPRICQGCSDTSQCPSTQFCDFEQGGTEDEIANPSIGLCVDLPPTCPDDSYADNHDQNDAYPIPSFPFNPMDADTPLFCRENTNGEWFAFNATAGQVITIQLDYAAAGNLDVALLRSDGSELVSSSRPPDEDNGTELIRYGVESDANFLVQVRGSILTDNEPYNLSISLAAPAACTDDAFEENDDLMSPSVLDPTMPQMDLQVCGNDSDFYTLQAGPNKVVTINSSAVAALGDIDLVLYDSNDQIVGQSSGLQDSDEIFYVTTAAEDLTLEVRVSSGVGNVDYVLGWTQIDNVCTDQFEVNDVCNDATVLTSGTYSNLAICSDADYYAVDLSPLQTVTFRATYDPAIAAGDLDITLFGPNDCATFLASETREMSMGSTVTEVITYQAQFGGRHNLLANLFSGINVPYELEVDIQDGPPCVDDANEDDDDTATANAISRASAAAGTDNVFTGLKICDDDADWFQIDLLEGDVLEWRVKFDATLGDIDAFLVAPDGSTVIAAATSPTADEEIVGYTVGVGEAGTYYLHVEAKFAARTDYWVLTYLNGAGPADPDCPDAFENNDDAMTAAPITDGTNGLLLCGDPVDDDWFSTTLQAGERIDIDLSFLHATGDIDLYFFDDRSLVTPIVQSRTTTDNESLSYNSARTQTVTWRILTTGTTPAIPYDMVVTKTPAGLCADDGLGGASSATAGVVEAPTTNAEGLYPGLTLCEGTDDWFEVDLTAGVNFEAFINFSHAQADLNLTLYDSGLTAVGTSTSLTDDESVIYTVPTTGTYYIQVESVGDARLVYDLLLYADGIGNEKRACPDPFELNDSSSQAAPIALGTTSNLLLCSDNGDVQDWYAVYVPDGASVTADVLFTHSEGDIDVSIYRAPNVGTALATSDTTDDNEQVTAMNSGAGANYLVRVYNKPGALFTSRYAIDISLTFSTMCMDDATASASQSAANAAAATSTGIYDALTLCEGTEDWFKLPNGANTVEANIELSALVGDIDLALVDAGGAVIAESVGTTGTEELSVGGLTGQHFLRVSAKDGAFFRNDYDLWLAVNGGTPPLPYCPDPYERNDTQASAAGINYLTQKVRTDTIACGPDVDYYRIELSPSVPYNSIVFFDHVAGVMDLTVEILDDTGMVLTSSASSTNDEIVAFTPTSAGSHYVKVTNDAGSTTESPYVFYFNDARFSSCPEDTFEPNNSAAAPATLAGTGTYVLGSCTGANNADDDYFVFTADNSGTVDITAKVDSASLGLLMRVFNTTQGTFQQLTPTDNRMIYSGAANAGDQFSVEIINGTGTGPYILEVAN